MSQSASGPDPPLTGPMVPEPLVYCLTRDHDLAGLINDRLASGQSFFYNDAARLHQAIILRQPDRVVIDTNAIRKEYGDAGLGPVVAFVRERSPVARIAVRPTAGAEWLVAAEAGDGVTMLPADGVACVEAVLAFCAPSAS